MNVEKYWGYINTNYKWSAWLFVNKKTEVKLGPFKTKAQALEAVKEYESSN